ncbi:MAG: type II secretion system F family protein [Thermoplasmata archaeon]|nr:type II secretion system F family protein [Thermoplasmata archaeon]
MPITKFQKLAYSLPGISNIGGMLGKRYKKTFLLLQKAGKDITPEVYYSALILAVIVSFVSGLIIDFIIFGLFLPFLEAYGVGGIGQDLESLLTIIIPVITTVLGYFIYHILGLKMTVRERAKKIDRSIPYAVNYMAAMASADVSPADIFRGLATQEIYGEIQKEAEKIARDIDLLGMDLMGVLKRAIVRSPSEKWAEFLQGTITTSSSGGSLKKYFEVKAEEYMRDARLNLQQELQSLGVMAESFVTVVVAAPLFLIIIMAVMAMLGDEAGEFFLTMIVAVMIPLMQLLFAIVLKDAAKM